MNITTRLATQADIPACADVHIESCLDIYRPFISAEVHTKTLPDNLNAVWADEQLENGDFIVMAEDAGNTVGIVTVRNQSTPYIDHFHVTPARKSGGIGRLLMRATLTEMLKRGMDHCYLDVADGNDAALAFYKAMGGEIGEFIEGDLFGTPLRAQIIRWSDLLKLNL
ncbi:MAG: GNAT family N-acetyltransferase [Paracoccaceae bacterium]|jgi:ribosomal protein S18 acetylase RimI-like enzyme|nr:GNAT family N-acetyltransferase [Paracoccaceae bacterium]MDG1371095.1 GNAT family N-acetyltransferase [Paracoccaceae bacterium]